MNLIFVFNAIMTERSITRASDRLGMTQPAVSNIVSRMRLLWNDPMFIKKGRTIEPTAFAKSLWEQVKLPLSDLNNALDVREFHPATSKRKFKIAIRDAVADMVWLELSKQLTEIAPGVDLYAVPYTLEDASNQLREATIDLAVGKLSGHDNSIRSHWLFDSDYVLLMREDHPLANKPIQLEDFIQARHLMVSFSGNSSGVVDQTLSEQGHARRVSLTVNHFAIVPELLRNSDMIATIPRIATGGLGYEDGIRQTDLPFKMEPASICLAWHTRDDRDPGSIWMRNLISEVIKERWQLCSVCHSGASTKDKKHIRVAA
ncbi:LysR family transcriptional regulator [Hahella sp. CCB-MM4]|uniref:LysR family transcriptional regulator n=1 Tax=Hahella sp. (strain CCB-MM4) TaxID=1926491 RepID=UPI001FED9EEE|nr:LysR family transcriptional regulator [Hahella sp. CCB-MM4]